MITTPWKGRDDGPGAIHTRWHHMVYAGQEQTGQEASSLAVLGFRSHEGTIRAQGRAGAVDGPDSLRHALAQLAFHGANVVHDRGDVTVEEHRLEDAVQRAGRRIAEALREHKLTAVLGGGHETTWAAYQGLVASGKLDAVHTWGVLSLDSHLGLSQQPEPNATTVFDQIARAEKKAGRGFRYLAVGISEADNTRARFENAQRVGARYLKDVQAQESALPEVLDWVRTELAELELLHLSVDLDVLPGWVAPGVSNPATLGVPLYVVEQVCTEAAGCGKLELVDVVGLNPRHDIDDRTARAGARLLHWITAASFDRPAADAADSAAQRQLLAERTRSLEATLEGTDAAGAATAQAAPSRTQG